MKIIAPKNGIPVSPTLIDIEETLAEGLPSSLGAKRRLIRICVLAVIVAAAISFIARMLVYLINMVTNLSFFGLLDINFHSPAMNHLGLWVMLIPVIGGVVVGLMALYGSKAIRGHGIPEAMEQILVNKSRIKPSITFLKPISSAIAIGTGGPFGAEGPIIATGGALGSTFGQIFKVTANERKIILAAGATAGMSAIFGSPIAAVFLAIELLLFEFSPRSILPVALACITGAAGHHLLFESGPVFPMPELSLPSNQALAIYSAIGLIIGFLSLGLTKVVYLIEDAFEELPIHWMWWPAIGGLAVGIIGYFQPHTLGVGYDNITSVLSGSLPLTLILSLCFFKFLSWAIALGSGTSGGTLAPLLTIGGAAGAVLGTIILTLFPHCGLSVSMAALVGMSAMFAGASRAYLTSITFALETTMQSHALLPLLGACTASYLVSFFLMENTIMTEKIARRGVVTPDSYAPDMLEKLKAGEAADKQPIILSAESTIGELREEIKAERATDFIVCNKEGSYVGTVKAADILHNEHDTGTSLKQLITKSKAYVKSTDSLRKAVEQMAKNEIEALPVISAVDKKVIGLLTYKDILSVYKEHFAENENANVQISLKLRRNRAMIKGKRIFKAKNG